MERWKQDRVLKKARKRVKKELEAEGYDPKTAKRLIKNALKRIDDDVKGDLEDREYK